MNPLPVQIKILDDRIATEYGLPKYQSEHAAGIDLVACIDEDLVIAPGETKLIPTGISVFVNDPNFASVILPRSGLGHKQGLILGNGTGLIDADYQGPLMVSAWNRNHALTEVNRISNKPYSDTIMMVDKNVIIKPGDRIAQLVFLPIARAIFAIVDGFDSMTERGEGGFGSTGIVA